MSLTPPKRPGDGLTLADVQAMKAATEKQILEALIKFYRATGMRVEEVDLGPTRQYQYVDDEVPVVLAPDYVRLIVKL